MLSVSHKANVEKDQALEDSGNNIIAIPNFTASNHQSNLAIHERTQPISRQRIHNNYDHSSNKNNRGLTSQIEVTSVNTLMISPPTLNEHTAKI